MEQLKELLKGIDELKKQQEDRKRTFREEIKCEIPQEQQIIGHNPIWGDEIRGRGTPPDGVIVESEYSSFGGTFWEGYEGFGNLEPLKKGEDYEEKANICRE